MHAFSYSIMCEVRVEDNRWRTIVNSDWQPEVPLLPRAHELMRCPFLGGALAECEPRTFQLANHLRRIQRRNEPPSADNCKQGQKIPASKCVTQFPEMSKELSGVPF